MFEKISDEELNAVGVTGLPDTPGLSTLEMQKKFDEPAKQLIAPKFNKLVDDLNDIDPGGRTINGGGAQYIRVN